MLRIVVSNQAEQDTLKLDLDALVREGARRMLLAALKAEVDEYVAEHADHRDDAGHALVVRNGVSEPRKSDDGRRRTGNPGRRVSTIDAKAGASPVPSCRRGHDDRRK